MLFRMIPSLEMSSTMLDRKLDSSMCMFWRPEALNGSNWATFCWHLAVYAVSDVIFH